MMALYMPAGWRVDKTRTGSRVSCSAAWLAVWVCAACGSDAGGSVAVADAAAQSAPSATPSRSDAGRLDRFDADAGPGPSGEVMPDLHFLLVTMLVEIDRSMLARCPCQVAGGDYATIRDCVDTVSLGRDWVDCVNSLDLTGEDAAPLRDNLHCNIEELMQRSECLEVSSCSEQDVQVCLSKANGCPMPPLMVLSRLATECPILFSH